MIDKETKQIVLKTFESLQSQLETMREKADIVYHSRIKMALSSIEAARTLLDTNKEFDNVLYFLGRCQWTLGFIMGTHKENSIQVESTDEDTSEITKVTRLPTL